MRPSRARLQSARAQYLESYRMAVASSTRRQNPQRRRGLVLSWPPCGNRNGPLNRGVIGRGSAWVARLRPEPPPATARSVPTRTPSAILQRFRTRSEVAAVTLPVWIARVSTGQLVSAGFEVDRDIAIGNRLDFNRRMTVRRHVTQVVDQYSARPAWTSRRRGLRPRHQSAVFADQHRRSRSASGEQGWQCA